VTHSVETHQVPLRISFAAHAVLRMAQIPSPTLVSGQLSSWHTWVLLHACMPQINISGPASICAAMSRDICRGTACASTAQHMSAALAACGYALCDLGPAVLDNLTPKPSRYAVPTTPGFTDLVTLVCNHVHMTRTHTAYQSARLKICWQTSRRRTLSHVTSCEVPLWQSHDEAQANARAKTTHCWRKPFLLLQPHGLVDALSSHAKACLEKGLFERCESERKYFMDTNATRVLDRSM